MVSPTWAEAPQKVALRSVPTLAAPVAKGAVVAAENISATALPASQVFASTAQTAAQVVGMQATRNLAAGVPLSTLHLRVPPLVARGAVVPFVVARGGVQLSGSAQALEDGQAGQSIRLMNPATRATLVGVVQSNGHVVVN